MDEKVREIEARLSEISDETPERVDLFEPGFTRRSSRVRMKTGLYTAYNIIQQHGGEIQVQSRLGEDTKFIVVIPVKRS